MDWTCFVGRVGRSGVGSGILDPGARAGGLRGLGLRFERAKHDPALIAPLASEVCRSRGTAQSCYRLRMRRFINGYRGLRGCLSALSFWVWTAASAAEGPTAAMPGTPADVREAILPKAEREDIERRSSELKARARAMRDEANARHAQERARCWQEFLVSDCLEKARQEQKAAERAAGRLDADAADLDREVRNRERDARRAAADARRREDAVRAGETAAETMDDERARAQRAEQRARDAQTRKADAEREASRQAQRDADKAAARARMATEAAAQITEQKRQNAERDRRIAERDRKRAEREHKTKQAPTSVPTPDKSNVEKR